LTIGLMRRKLLAMKYAKIIEWLIKFAVIVAAVFLVAHGTTRSVAAGVPWWHMPLCFSLGWFVSGVLGAGVGLLLERRNRER